MFKSFLSNLFFPAVFYSLLCLICLLSIPAFSQVPTATGDGEWVAWTFGWYPGDPACTSSKGVPVGTPHYETKRTTPGQTTCYVLNSGEPCNEGRVWNLQTQQCDDPSCPAGQIPNTIIDGSGNHITSCIDDTGGEPPQCDVGEAVDPATNTCVPAFDEPQDCGSDSIDVTAVQLTSGEYICMPGANYPCDEGMIPGTVIGSAGTINICDQPNGDSSSSSGNNSSSNNSDGGDDGEGSGSSSGNENNSSSSAPAGCPIPANSTCPNKYEVNGQWYCTSGGDFCSGGGGSSASSSTGGGSGSSVGAGQCDPTAKNYLECLNTKELEIPSEKGSYDGTGGTSTEDRIGELEGELQGVVDQIKSEINDTIGVSLSGGGTLTDQCYQIMKVQVCFGWARWSQHLALIANAILAMAYIASFIIIMRQ